MLQSQKVELEENIWLGANVVINPGTLIEKNTIIGAGCNIKAHIKKNSIVKNNSDLIIEKKMKIIKKFLISIIKELWPLNRSITGNGVRKTHKILSKIHKFKTIEVKSGTKCFDWTVPKEWNVREAYILDLGKK